jgi:PAS domain S-box-containing protein
MRYTKKSIAFLILGISLFLIPRDALAAVPTKRILILFPYESNMPGFLNFDASFRSALAVSSEYQFEFFVECMDLTRFPDGGYYRMLMELYHEKYSNLKLDLIVANLRPSLDFLERYGPESLRQVPVILSEQDPRLLGARLEVPVAAVVTDVLDLEGTLALAMRLHPDVRNVFVVSGASRFDRSLEGMARERFRHFESQFEFHYLSGLPMDELIQRTSHLPEHSLLFYMSVFKDGNGKAFKSPDALALIAKEANTPIYSVSETYIGSGIVGGHILSHTAHGARVAGVALRILRGEKPGHVESPDGSGIQYVFDARRLHRWGISEESLPPGSIVRYREFSLWETYRWQILGLAAILSIQVFLISTLIVSLRKQRLADRALREAELKYRTVADFTHDWEYWSAPDGRLLYNSPSCERITGYSSRHFMEDPSLFGRILDPEDHTIWEEHVRASLLEHQFRTVQLRIRTRDGSVRWIEHVCRPVTDERGEFLGIRASNRDITDRKNAELEAQQHREALAHVTRTVTLGELATSLAHEINQPLTAILCNAGAAQRFLAGNPPDLDEVRKILSDIIQDDKRASEVIQGIRNLVKKEPPRRETVNLNDAVQETLALVRTAWPLEETSLVTELDSRQPAVLGDRIQLQQVLLNLVLNAAAAMKDTPQESRQLVITTVVQDGGSVMVSVRDSGTGIDKDFMDRLFEPFCTKKVDGLGMGLSISRSIIKAHGGTIGARNNPEGGATFYFTLPMDI